MPFAFERHDADGDGEIDAYEAMGLLAAIGFEAEKMGAAFENVDRNHDGKMTAQEWATAGNIHPKIAMRVTTGGGFDKSFQVESADFGPLFRDTLGTTYNFALAVGDPINGCTELQGESEIYEGKIVLLKRGVCEFCIKAKMAQEKGAKAVMVADNEDDLIHMTVGTCGGDVTIPSIMIMESAGTDLETLAQSETADVYFPTCLNDGIVMAGYGLETCDDGNTDPGDGCNSKCILECGNSVIDGSETCDDGNQTDGDGCASTCSLEHGFVECSRMGCSTQCGDGIVVGGRDGCESAGDSLVLWAFLTCRTTWIFC